MRIRLFSVLWVSCSMVCVVVCIAAVISSARAVHVKFTYHNRRWEIGVEKGWIIVDDFPQVALDKQRWNDNYMALAAKSHDLLSKLQSLEFDEMKQNTSREQEEQQAEQRHDDAVELYLQARGELPISGVYDPDARKRALHDLDLSALAPLKHKPSHPNHETFDEALKLSNELGATYRAMLANAVPATVQSHRTFALILLPPLLVLPLFRYRAHLIRKTRLHGGLCLNCGYNLHATPNRCPECGTLRDKPRIRPLRVRN